MTQATPDNTGPTPPEGLAPSDTVLRAAPRWAWDILDETLALDAESGSFDIAIREDIAHALGAVKTVGAFSRTTHARLRRAGTRT